MQDLRRRGRAARRRGGKMDGVLTNHIPLHGTCKSSYHTIRPQGCRVPGKIFLCIQHCESARRRCRWSASICTCASHRVLPTPFCECH